LEEEEEEEEEKFFLQERPRVARAYPVWCRRRGPKVAIERSPKDPHPVEESV